jgi:tRNA modification GTPase
VKQSVLHSDTIAAIATGGGGAIAIVRISGPEAIAIADKVFTARNRQSLSRAAGYTVHFGEIRDGAEVLDEVLATVFRTPHSYTGEDSVEISCHASPYIENRIMQLLVTSGARMAEPGEFTVRAFLAGKMDLSEAEAVADLIASTDRAQHSLAFGQMRGTVSSTLAGLRSELLGLAALLELELDFGEEDVEFASRSRLADIAGRVYAEIEKLAGSFLFGNAIREGIPVAIVGRPNAGKSTLLNALVGDDRAMVSDIAGTTRDRIEERVNIEGVGFRFIDTAGLRATDDVLEQMGIDRALEAASRARIVLLVVDAAETIDIVEQISELGLHPDQKLLVVINKTDRQTPPFVPCESLAISAKTGQGIKELEGWLAGAVDAGSLEAGAAVVSNARHYEALIRAQEATGRVSRGIIAGLSADLLAEDIREVLHHLGTITGEITTDEILGTIFSKFCIGK